mmetsp:Transcript_11480/g.20307  ORF Transcript_11480/g.20307 Transcript_11480/m.20307 type:complete len:273 (-) Transcript_11480:1116-1934(-)
MMTRKKMRSWSIFGDGRGKTRMQGATIGTRQDQPRRRSPPSLHQSPLHLGQAVCPCCLHSCLPSLCRSCRHSCRCSCSSGMRCPLPSSSRSMPSSCRSRSSRCLILHKSCWRPHKALPQSCLSWLPAKTAGLHTRMILILRVMTRAGKAATQTEAGRARRVVAARSAAQQTIVTGVQAWSPPKRRSPSASGQHACQWHHPVAVVVAVPPSHSTRRSHTPTPHTLLTAMPAPTGDRLGRPWEATRKASSRCGHRLPSRWATPVSSNSSPRWAR